MNNLPPRSGTKSSKSEKDLLLFCAHFWQIGKVAVLVCKQGKFPVFYQTVGRTQLPKRLIIGKDRAAGKVFAGKSVHFAFCGSVGSKGRTLFELFRQTFECFRLTVLLDFFFLHFFLVLGIFCIVFNKFRSNTHYEIISQYDLRFQYGMIPCRTLLTSFPVPVCHMETMFIILSFKTAQSCTIHDHQPFPAVPCFFKRSAAYQVINDFGTDLFKVFRFQTGKIIVYCNQMHLCIIFRSAFAGLPSFFFASRCSFLPIVTTAFANHFFFQIYHNFTKTAVTL